MKLAKSLLLGSAAGFVAVAGAQAADLPTRKAAPVEYVRICAVHGPGFFYIPGTDTCIKIGGRARFEYLNIQQFGRGDNSSFSASGRVTLDARTSTDWGLLRAFVRVNFVRNSGNGYFGSGSATRSGRAIAFQPSGGAVSFPNFGGQDTQANRLQEVINIDSAFVQWGGLTAGRLQSFFDFYADNDTWSGAEDSDVVTNLLAYTYTFGSGFSATLSIEDPRERDRYPIAGGATVAAGGILATTAPGAGNIPGIFFNNVYPFAFSPFAGPFVSGISYTNRESIPDVVGALRVDQAWGSAQLSGAYHRISTVGGTAINNTPNNTGGLVLPAGNVNPVGTVPGGFGAVTGNGWAVQAGVKINLPMIAAGDYFYLQAAYSKGELSYIAAGWPGSFSAAGFGSNNFSNILAYDAVVGPSGQVRLTPAYSAVASYEHYWTPTIRQSLVGSFAHVSYGSGVRTAAGFAQGAACPSCFGTVAVAGFGGPAFYNPFSTAYLGFTQYVVTSQLVWSPVKDLDIGVEIAYARDQYQHRAWDTNEGVGRTIKYSDVWLGRMRVSRDF